jgi:NTE family protein
VAAVLPYRSVQVMALQPSQSLDEMAQSHAHELPTALRRALGGLGRRQGAGALASYLLFEPGFIGALIALGERDAHAKKDALLAFAGAATA